MQTDFQYVNCNPVQIPPARLTEIDQAFERALDLPPEARRAFVDGLAARDALLAAEVQELLAQAERASGTAFFARQVSEPLAAALADELTVGGDWVAGDSVGRYRIVRELGRGGMAIVYLAERADGQFEQRVAIKRLHHGLGTVGALSRFHQERQILATLNHPSIARLLDGGVDREGFPYLVMEYIDGLAIDRYADEHRLTIRERLDLVIQVTRAIEYAHHHLVVHRDIKPSNILVTADREVKLLDFGIAKLVQQNTLDSVSPATQTVMRALTPDYASPEQISGDRVTTASDVYQLGLLLYELLAGMRARRTTSHPHVQATHVTAEPPPRPSTAVASAGGRGDEIAQARGTTRAGLTRALRGDLDNIVRLALDASPEARYASAAALAEDIRRHMDGRPVAARAEARLYRTARFVRRHALALGASAAIAVLLVAYAVTASIQAARLARERDRVQAEAAKAQGVTDFLLGLFEIPSNLEANYASLTARQVLEHRAARVDELAGQPPAVQAEVMSTVAFALLRLGSHDQGIDLARRSLEIRLAQYGEHHVETAESLFRLGVGLNMKGDSAASEPHLRRALEVREQLLEPNHADIAESLCELATPLHRTGRLQESEALLLRALTITRAADNEYQARVLNNLGNVKVAAKDDDAAATFYEQAIAYRRARFGNGHPDLATNLSNLARVYLRRGDFAGAIPLLEESAAGVARIQGEDYVGVGRILAALGSAYAALGNRELAEARLVKGLDILKGKLPADHADIAKATAELERVTLDR